MTEEAAMPISVVTGSSTGIGLATAVELARGGHDVYATMRDLSRSAELRAIAEEESLPIRIVELDVDSEGSVTRGIGTILTDCGHIDALVNNAGVATYGAVEDLPITVFQSTMETNYLGALRCIKAVLPSMRERRAGCIVNVSSVAGRLAPGGHASYAASKYALEALSECLAQEVRAFGIRVAIVEPGTIRTPIFDKLRDPPKSEYPHEARLRTSDATDASPSPFVVGRLIREIVDGEGAQLRYPVGGRAADVIAWRSSITDEEWIDFNA
jgi:NAD(P)-dependent dehydrogenase (short-subunit alcohol dehydrogenase family)